MHSYSEGILVLTLDMALAVQEVSCSFVILPADFRIYTEAERFFSAFQLTTFSGICYENGTVHCACLKCAFSFMIS